MVLKCPCETCILFAVCIKPDAIRDLASECDDLFNYIVDKETSEKSIKLLKPRWFCVNPHLLGNEIDALLNTIVDWRQSGVKKRE